VTTYPAGTYVLKVLLCTFCILSCLDFSFAQDRSPAVVPSDIDNQKGFIENTGQIKDQTGKPNQFVKYLLQLSGGLNIQLKANSFSYDTYSTTQKPESRLAKISLLKQGESPRGFLKRFHRVDVSFLGANPTPEIFAETPSSSYTNYCNTDDKNILSVHSYQKITYRNIYPHIDLVFQAKNPGEKKKVEYFFIVRPGGNVNQIQIKYAGALKTQLKQNGIEVSVEKGEFTEQVPSSFISRKKIIDIDDLFKENSISISYKKSGINTYGFNAPAYDRSQTLIIDPTPDLVWGTYYGGSLNDISYSIAKDAAGNIFIGGATNNDNAIATTGAYQTQMLGYDDGFIAKFTSDGRLLWATYYGGSNYENIYSIAVDKNNDLIVAGSTFSPDNMATPGAYQTVKTSPTWGTSAFIAKFGTDGMRKWGTYFGGEGVEAGYAVTVDNGNNILLTGSTTSFTGIATNGAYQTAHLDTVNVSSLVSDAYLVKFDSNGNRIWGTYFGGIGQDAGYGITTDKQDNIIITGLTYSNTGIATNGAAQPAIGSVAPQGGDGFVAKFNNAGSLQWATYCGGNSTDYGWCLGADSNGNIFVGGVTGSTNGIATPGTQQTTTITNNFQDGFLMKYNANGAKVWGTYYGGGGSDLINGLAVDAADNIWITGATGSNVNMATPGTYQPTMATTPWSVFVAKFANNGLRVWGTYYGSGGIVDSQGNGIVITGPGEAAVTGETGATAKVATCGAAQLQWAGNQDAFVAKFSETNSSTLPAVSVTQDISGSVCAGSTVTFTAIPTNGGTTPAYQWKLNGNNVGLNSNTYVSNNLKNGDIVTCSLTSNSACITAPTAISSPLTVSISNPVTPSISIVSSTNNTCTGTSVTFTATSANQGTNPSFQWRLNNVDVGTNSPTYTSTTLVNGDLISCVLTNPSVCVTTSTAISNVIKIVVSQVATPSVNITSSNNNVCEGSLITFTAIPVNGGNNPVYQWQLNNQNVGSNSSQYATSRLKNGDVVNCVMTASASNCSVTGATSNSLTMNINTAPVITLTASDLIVSKGKSTSLNALVTGSIQSYQWTPATGLSDANIPNPIATPLTTTTYQLTVTSANGCQAMSSIKISVMSGIKIFNTFTPNDDGTNDVWDIPGIQDYPGCIVNIYDRYGQQIFHSISYSEPWDGTLNNKPLPFGVYYYIINLKDNRPPLSGYVTIIR
jgi:gliding motility-associated-like protein